MQNFNHKFDIHNVEVTVGNQTIKLETGLIAKQSDGAVVATMGETMVLATAVSTKEQKPGISDFTPLTVNYKERTYAAGKIPGGFFKREGRASKKETLSSRIIDRTIRPIFPEGFACETNVTAMVISSDDKHDADVLSVLASSAALVISSIPFNEPVAAVRIGRKDGQYIVNPTKEEQETCDMDLVIAGSAQGLLMVEGGAKEVEEEAIIKAMEVAKPEIDKMCAVQLKLREMAGKPKFEYVVEKLPQEVADLANGKFREEAKKILHAFSDKQTRDTQVAQLKASFTEELTANYGDNAPIYAGIALENIMYEESRNLVLHEGVRVDGRKPDEIRPLSSMVGLLPRAHGSALFTRGEQSHLLGGDFYYRGRSYSVAFDYGFNCPSLMLTDCLRLSMTRKLEECFTMALERQEEAEYAAAGAWPLGFKPLCLLSAAEIEARMVPRFAQPSLDPNNPSCADHCRFILPSAPLHYPRSLEAY